MRPFFKYELIDIHCTCVSLLWYLRLHIWGNKCATPGLKNMLLLVICMFCSCMSILEVFCLSLIPLWPICQGSLSSKDSQQMFVFLGVYLEADIRRGAWLLMLCACYYHLTMLCASYWNDAVWVLLLFSKMCSVNITVLLLCSTIPSIDQLSILPHRIGGSAYSNIVDNEWTLSFGFDGLMRCKKWC